MKHKLTIILLFSLVNITYSTSIPPPNVRYRIINNTNDIIYKIIQIQSDSEDFLVYDTFAIEMNIIADELHLFTSRNNTVKSYQRLIVSVGDNNLQTENFDLLGGWRGYKLTINPGEVLLSKTNYFKIHKVISDLIICFAIILILKGLVYLIVMFRFLKSIYKELLIINLFYSVALYYSIDSWLIDEIPVFGLVLLITVLIGVTEYIVVVKKINTTSKNQILISTLIGNLLSVFIGGILIIILNTFMGIIINLP